MSQLARILLSALGAALDDDTGEIEQALADQLASARAVWPGVDAADAEVIALAADHLRPVADGGSLADRIHALAVHDLYIACACAAGSSDAVRAFEARYFTSLPAVLARMGADAASADEVRQILREKLFVTRPEQRARVLDLAGQGDLGALVRIAAVRTMLNLRRAGHRLELVEHPSIVSGVVLGVDPESGIVKEIEREQVERAFEEAITALEPRDRNVLRMHLLHGLSIDEIGRVHGVHRATAARWLERIRLRLRDDTAQRLRERLSLSADEIDSLIEFVHSRLDISFDRLLQS